MKVIKNILIALFLICGISAGGFSKSLDLKRLRSSAETTKVNKFSRKAISNINVIDILGINKKYEIERMKAFIDSAELICKIDLQKQEY